MDFKYCKLEIFIPETHLPVLQKTLREVDAGHIGNYDSCMSSSEVIGYWRPLEGCNPYIGNEGEISKEPEVKVEDIAEEPTEDEESKDAIASMQGAVAFLKYIEHLDEHLK